MNKALWVVQVLLAALFLFAGGLKLVMSAEALAAGGPFPVPFLRFIAVCEVLGAIGLILPGLLKIGTSLTPLAAAGLVIIMIGATVSGIMSGMFLLVFIPAVTGLLAAFVAYGRWRGRETTKVTV